MSLDHDMDEMFTDEAGTEFTIVRSDTPVSLRLSMRIQKREAALAWARKEGGVLFLADIHVKNALCVREPNPIKWLFGKRSFTVNFRQQGLGTHLIKVLIAYARSEGFRRIEGQISDVGADPEIDLPKWYRSRGFMVHGSRISLDVTQGEVH